VQGRNTRRLAWVGMAGFLALTAFGAMAALPPNSRVPQANLNKTIEAQKRLTSQQPDDAAAWNDLGNLLVLANRPGEAEDAYRKAVTLDPQKESSLFNLALLLQQKGQTKEALKTFEQVLKVAPGNAWAHYQIGAIRERKGDESAAIRAYSQAFALDPQLAFPEVNPQIVDNRLATQAMLKAYRQEGSIPRAVPPVYDDPRRIRDLLVPPPTVPQTATPVPVPSDKAAAGSQAGAQQTTRVLTGRDLGTGSAGAGQATPSGSGEQPYRIARPGSQPGEIPAQAGVGFGVPNYGNGRQAIPRGGTQEWRRPGGATGTDPNNPYAYPNGGGTGGYYRPGGQSTGRIGLRVIPLGQRDGNG
jgi:hypothetical protein